MRCQRGQTAAEYLGVLVLIAVLVLGLSQTRIGEAVGASVKAKVCEIAQGDGCASPATATAPPGGGAPTSGPPLGGVPRTLPVLPFPGSASVSCKVSVDPGATPCQGGGKVEGPDGKRSSTVDAGARAKGSVVRGSAVLNYDGCPTTSLSVSAALEYYGKVAIDGKVAGAGAEVYKGQSVDYGVTTTPSRADDYAGGTPLPNPLDPRTLQPGEAIELGKKYYEGSNLEGSYYDMQAALGFEQGRKLSSGVKRLDDTTVRVYVGDADYVKQSMAIGVSQDGEGVTIGGEGSLTSGKLRSVDIDISTPAGWAAYQQFATTGVVPEPGAAGTTNPATSDATDLTSKLSAGVKLPGIDITAELGSGEAHRIDTHNADGTTTMMGTVRDNQVGITVKRTLGSDGSELGDPDYTLNLQGVDPEVLAGYGRQLPITGLDGSGNAQVKLTDYDLDVMRNQAVDLVRAGAGGDPPLSRAEVKQQLAEHPGYVELPNGGQYGITDPLVGSLAESQSSEEALTALLQAGNGNATDWVTQLGTFAGQVQSTANRTNIGADLPGGGKLPGKQVAATCAS